MVPGTIKSSGSLIELTATEEEIPAIMFQPSLIEMDNSPID